MRWRVIKDAKGTDWHGAATAVVKNRLSPAGRRANYVATTFWGLAGTLSRLSR
jgi:hypothetical protein